VRITDEAHFHSTEQIETYITEAVRLCDVCGLADADRAVVLPKVIELLAAKQVAFEQTAPMMMHVPQGPQRR
jgi:hypothetical protein